MKEARFTKKQAEALDRLMESESVAEAARSAGVGRSTVYEWLADPAFSAELEERRRAEDRARLNALRALIPKAMVVLEGLMESTDQRIRLRAASEVLRAYQSLVLADPASPGRVSHKEEGSVELDLYDLPSLARAGVKRLLNGSLEPKGAQMLPSYLRLIEQLESPKGASEAPGKSAAKGPGKQSGKGRWWEEDPEPGAFLYEEMDEEEKEFMLEVLSKALEIDSSGNPILAGWQERVGELISNEKTTLEELDRGINEAQSEYHQKHVDAILGPKKAGEGD